jgi:integrase
MIVRVRGIKRVRAKGRVYYYHRATGTRLIAPPHSAAFIAEVHRLDKATEGSLISAKPRHEPRTAPHKAGTWGALVAAYRASPEFSRLAARTKRDYGQVLDYLAALDDMPLIQITSAACLKIRDRAFTQRKRRFANYVTHMLSVVLGWGKPRGYVAENAALGLPKIARPRDAPMANRAWSDEECAAVLDAATGGLRVAIALAMWAGPRGGDVVRMPWSAYDGQSVEWRQGKTGDPVWLPADRRLRAILDAMPRVATTIVTGASGRPWRPATLGKEFRALILRLLDKGAVRPGTTFHGLRTTAAKNLADLGVDIRAIQARLGHKSATMALHYSREAEMRGAGARAVHVLERREK